MVPASCLQVTRGSKSKNKEEIHVKEAELFQQYCFAEASWLRQAPNGAGVAQKNLSCSEAHALRQLVDHDHPELSVSRQCALLGLLSACDEIGICLRTLKRWRKALIGDGGGHDRRKGSPRLVSHKLSEEERRRILLTCNQPQYASLPPGQIVPALADQGIYIGSESSFYRVLHAHGQVHRRGRARPPQEPRPVPRLRASGANQVCSWDITYLPTTVRGIWLYLYLVMTPGAARWWPGMWLSEKMQPLQRIW